jgi:hypothetical protein
MSFAVVNSDTGEVIQTFPGDAVPDPVVWPNGDASHAVDPGHQHAQWRLVHVTHKSDRPDEFHENAGTELTISGGTLSYLHTWKPQPLAHVQKTLASRIDEEAERQRQLYLTPGIGQAAVYQQKLEEALNYISDPSSEPEDYLLLSSSVGTEGASVIEVARLVKARAAECKRTMAAVEKVRLSTKRLIANSKDVDTAIASYRSATWPNFQPRKI